MPSSLPGFPAHRIHLAHLAVALAASALAAGSATAAPVTTVYGLQGTNTLWTSTASTTANPAKVSTQVVGFTVGGTTYSTGVNDGLLPTGYTPASFQAFTPTGLVSSSTTLVATGSAMPPPSPTPIWATS